jgi:hypothetical protein
VDLGFHPPLYQLKKILCKYDEVSMAHLGKITKNNEGIKRRIKVMK